MIDVRINYQRHRHRPIAAVARRVLFRLSAGPNGWPMTFRAPEPGQWLDPGRSEHLYVHLPFCRTICPHCPYTKVRHDPDLEDRYARALTLEIGAYCENPAGVPPVKSLYLGGGTPSLTLDLAEAALAAIRPALAPDAEVAMEVHPAHADPGTLTRIRALGVNRISLGLETLSDDLLGGLGRGYTVAAAEAALGHAREAGFDCVDVNLIYGIPGQRPGDPVRDTSRCLDLGADQISAYPLFTFVHTAMGGRVASGRQRRYRFR